VVQNANKSISYSGPNYRYFILKRIIEILEEVSFFDIKENKVKLTRLFPYSFGIAGVKEEKELCYLEIPLELLEEEISQQHLKVEEVNNIFFLSLGSKSSELIKQIKTITQWEK
jgi:hypothetical protein